MDLSNVLGLIQTALELGLICSMTVLALYLSYSMLNVCDLSTDGCFTLGAVTGAVTAMAGHPILAIFAAMAAGLLSGLIVSVLQTRMGINSLLAGIIVNTALYSINIAIMGGASLLSLNKTQTVFSLMKTTLAGTPLAGQYKLLTALAAAALIVLFLTLFLRVIGYRLYEFTDFLIAVRHTQLPSPASCLRRRAAVCRGPFAGKARSRRI